MHRRWQRGGNLRWRRDLNSLRPRERRKRAWPHVGRLSLSHVHSGTNADYDREHESRRHIRNHASAARLPVPRRERLDHRRALQGRFHFELSRDLRRKAPGGDGGGFRNRRPEWDRFFIRPARQRALRLQGGRYGHDWRRRWRSGRFRQGCGGCDRLRRGLGRSNGARAHGLGARAWNGASWRLRGCSWRCWGLFGLRGLLRRDRFGRIGPRAPHGRRLCGGRHGDGCGVSPRGRRGWTSTSNRRRRGRSRGSRGSRR